MSNLVPEVYCSNFSVTKMFYIKVFGFNMKDENEEQSVARFNLGKMEFILEEPLPSDIHKNTIKLKKFFSSDIDFSCEVDDIKDLYYRIKTLSAKSLCSKIENKSFEQNGATITHQQFIARDPDGYRFRFYQ
ncbi:MAG: hypothetical protein BKP49_04785 [Treponema sp. CETP13]|nr:MAG: hypothetical protein BKP49_04785 [Treponema sp. CETP13]